MMEKIKISTKQNMEINCNSIVEIEDGAEASLIIRPERDMDLTLVIGKGCSVECLTISENSGSLFQKNHIGENSVIKNITVLLSEGNKKITNLLEGEHSGAYDTHLFIAQNGKLNVDSVLKHKARDTRGNVLIKGVVHDGAYAGLEAMAKIDKNASGTESFIAQHVLLLSPNAHARAKPQLEIENNDVDSKHAASVMPIDQDKIFYLTSRGIKKTDAKKLIVEGFVLSALEGMETKKRKRLEWLITEAL